jgi:hypothetical protein
VIYMDGLLTRRTYSIWDYDGSSLELYVLDHGDGPGARWAREVTPGPGGRHPQARGLARHAPRSVTPGKTGME